MRIGDIFNYNKEFYDNHKYILELLEKNKEDIKEYVFPDFKLYDEQKEIEEFNKFFDKLRNGKNIKLKNNKFGWLYFFGLTDNDNPDKEYLFTLPKDKRLPKLAEFEIEFNPESNLMRQHALSFKMLYKSNGLKTDIDLDLEKGKLYIKNKYPWDNRKFNNLLKNFILYRLRLK